MKWKSMSEMTLTEVKDLLEDIFGFDVVIKEMTYDSDENNIIVEIETTWIENNDIESVCEDELILTPETIHGCDWFSSEDKKQYKQYMIAKGYSEYWKNNPYI